MTLALRGCTGALPKPCRTSGSKGGGETVNKARLMFAAVMLLLIVQALLLALGSPPLGYFDGN
jgi:hypothetical protein